MQRAGVLAILVVLGGCQASETVVPRAAAVRAEALRFPTADELLQADTTTVESLQRYAVSEATARRWALAYARQKGPYGQPLTVCLALPFMDRVGTKSAHFFVLSTDQRCDWRSLLVAAQGLWSELGVSNADEPPTQVFAQALARSGQRFFSVFVASHSFRHPLYEAQRGLPGWLLRAATGGRASAGASCEPTALLLPQLEGRHYELLRYRCGAETRIFSHTRMLRLAEKILEAHADRPLVLFCNLRRNLLAKVGRPGLELALAHTRSLWTRHLAGGAR